MKSKHFMANTAQVPNLFNFQGHGKTLIDNRQFDPFRRTPNRDVFTFARLQLIIIMSQLNTGSYTIGVVGGKRYNSGSARMFFRNLFRVLTKGSICDEGQSRKRSTYTVISL